MVPCGCGSGWPCSFWRGVGGFQIVILGVTAAVVVAVLLLRGGGGGGGDDDGGALPEFRVDRIDRNKRHLPDPIEVMRQVYNVTVLHEVTNRRSATFLF